MNPQYYGKKGLIVQKTKNTYSKNIKQINFSVVDVAEIYGNKLAIIDSDIANMLLGYSNARLTIPANQMFTNVNKQTETGLFDLYDLNKPRLYDDNNAYKRTYIGERNAYEYSPHQFYNHVISNIEEPLMLSSQISLTYGEKMGYMGFSDVNSNEWYTDASNPQLFSEIKSLIDQIIKTANYVGMIIVISVALACSLIIVLIGDIYIQQYKKFLATLKAMGYSNKKAMAYVFAIPSIFSIALWILAISITFSIGYGIVVFMGHKGLAIPFGIPIWAPIVSLLIIGCSYVISLVVSSKQIRTQKPSILMTENTDE